MKSKSEKYHFIIDNNVIAGHETYLDLMRMMSDQEIDVSSDNAFQRLYKRYYFPAPVSHVFSDVKVNFKM